MMRVRIPLAALRFEVKKKKEQTTMKKYYYIYADKKGIYRVKWAEDSFYSLKSWLALNSRGVTKEGYAGFWVNWWVNDHEWKIPPQRPLKISITAFDILSDEVYKAHMLGVIGK